MDDLHFLCHLHQYFKSNQEEGRVIPVKLPLVRFPEI